ncbi:MAG: hypothetical protein AAF653_07045 [Chloroflexota bacterium]
MTEQNSTDLSLSRITTSSNRLRVYRRVFTRIYIVGFVIMLGFNYTCYFGTFVGKWGWAAIWPFAVFGYLTEYAFQDNAVLTERCMVYFFEGQ